MTHKSHLLNIQNVFLLFIFLLVLVSPLNFIIIKRQRILLNYLYGQYKKDLAQYHYNFIFCILADHIENHHFFL